MQNDQKRLNFYRRILIITAFAYFLYFLIYKISASLQDPMSPQLRLGTTFLFFAAYVFSYKSKKVKAKLRQITFFLSLTAILQLFYYTYFYGFQLTFSVSTIVIIMVFNLIFRTDLYKLTANIMLAAVILAALIITENHNSFIVLYYSSYLMTAALSYLVSYNIHKYNQDLEKKIAEQEIILDTIDLQVWYLKDAESYGKMNRAHAEFLGIKQEKAENKKLQNFLDQNEVKVCKKGNQRVFEEKKKIITEEKTENAAGEERLLSITKNPKLNQAGEVEYVVCSAEDITEKKKRETAIKENRTMLRNLTDQIPGAIYQFQSQADGSYFFPYTSKGLYELYEIESEADNPNVADVFSRIHRKDYTDFIESVEESKNNLSIWHQLYQVDLPQKGIRWIESDAQPEKLETGEVLWHGYTRDVTARKEQKNKLEQQYKFQKKLAEISSQLVNINLDNIDQKLSSSLKMVGDFFGIDQSYILRLADQQNYILETYSCSDPGAENCKRKPEKLRAENLWLVEKLKNKEILSIKGLQKSTSAAAKEKKLLKLLRTKSAVIVPILIDKEIFGFFLFASVREKRSFSERELNLFKIFTDVIKRAISKNIDEQRIQKLTYYDSLTGLYNRRFFEEEMKRLDTERKMPISIIMADLNGLKIINDSYGHEKGDQMLKKSAELLKSSLRQEDILARQGGDEFAVLLPNTGKKEVKNILDRIKENIAKSQEDELPLSIALGAATKNNFAKDLELVLKEADDEMYNNKLSESRSSKSNIVQGLLNALDAKSNETKEHAVRMTKLAFDFGEKLQLSNSELNRLSLLATLHDIGKTNIDDKILNKTGSLTDKEWEIMKKHSEQGYKIASSSEEFALVAEEIFAHHEHWDAKGYPRQLAAEDIPYLARIISIIDAYDVMTHDRSYQEAISKKEALAEIKRCAGSQFDPELAAEFIKMLKD